MDSSLPQRMPGQGNCPPGYRPAEYAGKPQDAGACLPIGKGVPAGGWKEAAPGRGPGYPPSLSEFTNAYEDATFPGSTGAASGYAQHYADWIRRLAGR